KIVRRGTYHLFGKDVQGFEIHYGVSRHYPLYFEEGNIKGTFVHGLFNDEKFESYKQKQIETFVDTMRKQIDVERIVRALMV
ncbi:MAG: cobyric acid synthase CobQ, partial [Campylobacterales bacterium]|nr:cobyric acid synthase CobQ [Campylobacterales bacterium]